MAADWALALGPRLKGSRAAASIARRDDRQRETKTRVRRYSIDIQSAEHDQKPPRRARLSNRLGHQRPTSGDREYAAAGRRSAEVRFDQGSKAAHAPRRSADRVGGMRPERTGRMGHLDGRRLP